jgi:predicted Zn-dependent peptidase
MTRTNLALALGCLLALSCGGPGNKGTTPDGTGGGGTAGGGTIDEPGVPGGRGLARDEILAASDLPATLDAPLKDDGLGVTIHRLANGMTVYISTDRKEPRFDYWIAVRAGSRHDPSASTGLAHYLEHMLFKGTDELGTLDFAKEKPHLDRIEQLYAELRQTDDDAKRAGILAEIDAETQKSAQYAIPNELDHTYRALGVTGLNAHTWHEETVYKADVPSNRFEAWVKVEAERFRDPQFRLFYPELEAVYEEKNRSLDNVGRRIMYALYGMLYPKHPYGTQPTIGIVEHLKNPAYTDMVEFFHRWYAPNNMAIVLAGDIDAATAIPVLEKQLGGWDPKPLSKPEPGALPALEGRSETTVDAEGENAVTVAWHTVGVNHADQPALEVMDWLMSAGGAGIIDVDLVLSQKLPRAGSNGTHYLEAGHWEIQGTAREGQTHADVEALLLGTVDKLKSGAFTQDDIDAIVLQAEMREMREAESNRSRVGKMGNAFLNHQTWEYASARSDRLRSIKVEDVVRVANKYLGDDFAVVKRVKGKFAPPKIDKPKITPIEIDPSKESDFSRAVKAIPAKELTPEWLEEGKHYARLELPAGKLLATKNERNKLFSVSYELETGFRDQKLLCLALDLLERSGTADMTAEELKKKLWRMGTTLSTSCGTEQVSLYVSGIDRNMEQSIQLLENWVRNPRLEKETLDKLVENQISQRKDWMEEPRVVAQALSAYAMRGKDSNYLLAPSNKQIRKATTRQLGKLLAKLPDYQHSTRYFGPRNPEDAAKAIAIGNKHKPLRARKPIKYRKTRGTEIYVMSKDVAQSQIVIFLPKPPLPIDDRPIAELYNGYVGGGMGGLIFQEIREARGLAYSAFAGHRAGQRVKDESGLFGFIGTQSDKTTDALRTMLEIVRALPMQPERLAKAQEGSDQRYRASRVDPRAVGGLVDSWDELGLNSDPRPKAWEAIKSFSLDDVKAFGDRLSKGNAIVSIMGDQSRIDRDALNELGKVREVKLGQIFSY